MMGSVTGETHVASLLPPTAAAPEPARRIAFVKAVALFWLLPRWYGPHLAVASIWRALAAHALSIALVPLVLLLSALSQGESGWLRELRVDAAQAVLKLAIASTRTGWSWLPALAVVGAVPVAELTLLVLATLAMPWCAGGDGAWSVWKRSVKNAYWSTTVLVPLALVLACVEGAWPNWWRELDKPPEELMIVIVPVAMAVPVVLWVRALVVGASRYVGDADGPAFSPREPLCDACGYRITGLPLESRCPECGAAARDSLPGGLRRVTTWQDREFRLQGIAELIRWQRRVLRGTDPFRRLPVHQGYSAARHFWWATFCLMLIVFLAALRGTLFVTDWGDAVGVGFFGVVFVLLPLLLQSMMMFAGCLWAQFRYGVRDYRVSAIACYYASPLLWPFIAVLFVGSFVLANVRWPSVTVLTIGLARLHGDEIAAILCFLSLVGSLVFYWIRLCGALRAVRYANV